MKFIDFIIYSFKLDTKSVVLTSEFVLIYYYKNDSHVFLSKDNKNLNNFSAFDLA